MTINIWKQQSPDRKTGPIEVLGDSIVVLSKILKEEDRIKAMMRREELGEAVNVEPRIAIDFRFITSIQEDYKTGGSIIIDRKYAVAVKARFADVLAVWGEIQNRMRQNQDV